MKKINKLLIILAIALASCQGRENNLTVHLKDGTTIRAHHVRGEGSLIWIYEQGRRGYALTDDQVLKVIRD